MYTHQEASEIRQQFWTILGQYLAPIPSASGEKVNWVNYKTGVKGIRFRMDAQNKYSFIAIEISCEDQQRLQFYQTFSSLRNQLPDGYEWIENYEDGSGKILSRIWREKNGPTLFNKQHWPELITFFKENILLLDLFWSENKDIFEMMS